MRSISEHTQNDLTAFLHSIKTLFIVNAASVAESDQTEQNSEEEEKIELESSESESDDVTAEEKKKKKRVGFRDRKVGLLHCSTNLFL